MFAEVAAIGRVGDVGGVLHLVGRYLEERHFELSSDPNRGRVLHGGIGRAPADHGEEAVRPHGARTNHGE